MRCTLVMLLFLATVAFGQPLQGPFAILNPSVWNGISQPQITLRNADTADVFYEVADTIFHAAVLLQNGETVAGPDAFDQRGSGWSRHLCKAIRTSGGWSALENDVYGLGHKLILTRGSNAIEESVVIDSGYSWDGDMTHSGSTNYGFTLESRPGGGCFAGWQVAWIYYNMWPPPGWSEGGEGTVIYASAAGWPHQARVEGEFEGCAYGISATDVHFVTDDSLLIFTSCELGFRVLSARVSEWQEYGIYDAGTQNCSAQIAGTLVLPNGRIFILSHRLNQGGTASLLELINLSTCTERLSLTADPKAAASHPDYGMAWLAGDYQGWYLFRADTTGAQAFLPGLLTESDGLWSGGEADITIGENGLIAALWVEVSGLDSNSYSLHLASLGWETPLGTTNPRFTPQPLSFNLSAYPNPFNSTLQIEYALPSSQKVKLSAYNLLGQETAVLFDGMAHAGLHAALWSPSTGTGIYFVRLETPEIVKTAKVVYLR